MSFIGRLFGDRDRIKDQPNARFGRFSDAYKSDEKYEAWDRSLELFEKGEYLASFHEFFIYLADEENTNVKTQLEDGKLSFTIYQGSKQLDGFIDKDQVKAEAKIAKTSELNIGFLRRLMEQNFLLKYCRYALDGEDNITIVFDTKLLDGSPYKLYFALKEAAVNADKHDDLLLNEFDTLDEINTMHTQDLPENERQVKIKFVNRLVNSAFGYMDSGALNVEQYPGGFAYLLLSLMYKLDYLVAPEGPSLEAIENMHRAYFANPNQPPLQKVIYIRQELKKLLDKDEKELDKELYKVISTFGITTPAEHEKVQSFIENELKQADWYLENKHHPIAQAIPDYIIGYCLFNYAVPLPDRELFHLYFEVMEHEFFENLGFKHNYISKGKLNSRAIKSSIEDIVSEYKDRHPKLKPALKELKFNDKEAFAFSYIKMIHDLDLSKKKKVT